MSKVAVIVVAGGSGRRMGADLPKQFLVLDGKPILMHTLSHFAEALEDCRIILVLPESHVDYWEQLCTEYNFVLSHTVCLGGETRFESVRKGLEYIGHADLVAVHDGVRPLVTPQLIKRVVADAKTYGAVVPVVTPVDSLREVGDWGSRIVDRNNYRIIQTPQVFHAKKIKKAYELPYQESFTDDASVVEASGEEIYLSEGDYANVKITTPIDLMIAEVLLRQ